jgi:SAM-dependent methyltransferase
VVAGRERHWFEPIADHLGAAYLRYSFTKGTEQEVSFLVDELGLEAGARVLDVGCGPGRHAHALAARGIEVVGIDLSWRFVALGAAAGASARFAQADARALPVRDGSFDAALSLCQGAFGLLGGPGADPGGEARVLEGMARAVRDGGSVVVSAFSSYFQVRHLDDTTDFDAATGVHHEHTSVRDEAGASASVELWTTCFTPRELRLLAQAAGLRVDDVWSVEPGKYGRMPPGLDTAEFLVKATKAGGTLSGR